MKLNFVFVSGLAISLLASTSLLAALDLKEISDAELQNRAKAELETSSIRAPSSELEDLSINEVVVPDLQSAKAEPRPWRLGFSYQSYSFSGQIKSTTGENFSLSETSSTPLFGLNLCRNITEVIQRLDFETCLDLRYGRQTVNFETSTGSVYRDVSINVFLPTLSGQLNWQPFKKIPMDFSILAGLAPYILVRNSGDQLVDGADYSTSYVTGGSLRFDLWRRIYLQGSYEFRDLIFNESTQAIQSHNFLATAGVIF